MKLLVFGRNGQVATELRRLETDPVSPRNRVQVTAIGRDMADLSDPAACAAVIRDCDARAVINAAAYTAVDRAETDAALAHRVNAEAPGAMARACAARDLPFVQISTDYVFDGRGTAPRGPGDPTAPLNVYGRTKLAGEDAVRAAGGRTAILRTSWVVSAHGQNFVTAMLRLAQTRDALDVVADQVGGPTPAAAIAAACHAVAAQLGEDAGKAGTYHFAGQPDIGWSGFARAIFARAGRAVTVRDIASADWPTAAARPLNSRLDCAATETVFGLVRPGWRVGLDAILAELGAAAAGRR